MSNYRPISVYSTVAIVFEQIVYDQLCLGLHMQSAENHRIFPSFFRTLWSMSLELGLTLSSLFSLTLTFQLSKSESLRDVSVTRIGDTFPTVFRRLYGR